MNYCSYTSTPLFDFMPWKVTNLHLLLHLKRIHAKWPGQIILPRVQGTNCEGLSQINFPLQSLQSKNLDGNRMLSFVTASEFTVGDPQHECSRRRLFPGHGTWGNSAVCASHVKGQHLPVYKVNRTQKQLPQPSGSRGIFEVIRGGWNKESHLKLGACSTRLGMRSFRHGPC